MDTSTPNELGAALVAEIGSSTTRVTLVDTVAGETRLIGQTEVTSTIEPPLEDAGSAILDATAQIAALTGRRLLQDGHLIMPQTNERDGVNAVLATTSAAGQMALVVAAVASDISARSALHASHTTYTSILQVITLNDASDTLSKQENTWIERQVQRLFGLHPDVVLMAGGLENGAHDALVRLAHIIGLTMSTSPANSDRQLSQNFPVPPVVFAGNSHSREGVIEALSMRTNLRIVDNVRPTLETERLEPARRELLQQYKDRILPRLPGLPALQRLCATPIHTSSEASGLVTRFLSEHYKRNTLSLDIGSANTAVHLHSQQHYTPTVLGGIGTGYGVGAILAERGPRAIMRWLPFPITEQDLVHRLLNKMLRPHSPPVTREDILIDHAIAREALSLTLATLWDERAHAPYDLVVASGGVLAHAPHPGLAALTILDALQPNARDSLVAIDVHLDILSLMVVCGTLAFANPDAALTVLEHDLLNNTPLATCVIPLGGGRLGEKAVEAEIDIIGGGQHRMVVQHGEIGRLEIPIGRKAKLTLHPFGHVRIGRNAPGAEVSTDVAGINGSALGVVIDARGRPLRLPESPIERQRALWNWMVALGVERGPLPYAEAVPLPEVPFPASIGHNGAASTEIASDAPLAPAIPSTGEPTLDELAKLRQTVEEPPKRGFFRRK